MIQRHVPKHVPTVFFGQSVVGAANAGQYAEFGHETVTQRGPLAVLRSDRKFANDWSSSFDRKRSAKLLSSLALPVNQERIVGQLRIQPGQTAVLAEVTVERGSAQRGENG